METGSFINAIISGPTDATVSVGDGCTITRWSDRTAATVIRVTKCTIVVQEDAAIRLDKNGPCEVQQYQYARDPEGRVYTFRKTKKGWRCVEGHGLSLGHRSAYYDYSF